LFKSFKKREKNTTHGFSSKEIVSRFSKTRKFQNVCFVMSYLTNEYFKKKDTKNRDTKKKNRKTRVRSFFKRKVKTI